MSPERRTRVLLAEDHVLVRSGIRALLERLQDFEVVGEAGDGRQVLVLVEQLRPDLVLMDITMPGLNGLDATQRIRKRFPATRVLVLSAHANEEYVAQALRHDASGYLLKGCGLAELELAVRAVARGEVYLTPAVSRQVVHDYLNRLKSGQRGSPLTSRQREILQLIAEGRSTKEVANELGLSVKTVESHRTHLMERLGVRGIQALVRYAIREGLVTTDR